MRKIIADKIKQAREEKKITQKDLADHLGKNAVSVSDIERNRVEVSAIEIYEIAKFLNKPIEYFFGEDFNGKEIQEIIMMLRKQSNADIRELYKPIRLFIELKNAQNDAKKFPQNQKIPKEKILEYRKTVYPLADTLNEMTEKINKLLDNLNKEAQIKKVEIPKK